MEVNWRKACLLSLSLGHKCVMIALGIRSKDICCSRSTDYAHHLKRKGWTTSTWRRKRRRKGNTIRSASPFFIGIEMADTAAPGRECSSAPTPCRARLIHRRKRAQSVVQLSPSSPSFSPPLLCRTARASPSFRVVLLARSRLLRADAAAGPHLHRPLSPTSASALCSHRSPATLLSPPLSSSFASLLPLKRRARVRPPLLSPTLPTLRRSANAESIASPTPRALSRGWRCHPPRALRRSPPPSSSFSQPL